MKLLQGLVLASCAYAMTAQAVTQTEVINAALKKGAIVVVCDGGECRDAKTHKYVADGEDGTYLMYPVGHENEEKETARLMAQAK
jgi:hypothetical protein